MVLRGVSCSSSGGERLSQPQIAVSSAPMLPTTPSAPIAPGAHVVVRDAVWRVVQVDTTTTGGRSIRAVGVDEAVRGHEGVFLDEYEPSIEVLDPAETRLVADRSHQYRASLLYIESHLRAVPPPDAEVHTGDRAALDVLPYQREPARLALQQLRPRILIADAVGLGKTLEAGILLAELIRRGRARRILVVTTKSMLVQFQKEMWIRFTIPLVRLDSDRLRRVRRQIPTNHNPFHFYDRTIVSMDTLKQNDAYRTHLEDARWDVIVIDEAHNVAERGSDLTHRAKLAERLSKRSDALILLSATPHDGRPRSFASLMNMLDPTAIANRDAYGKDDIQGLFIRRFKWNVVNEVAAHFPERKVAFASIDTSPAEESAFRAIEQLETTKVNQRHGGMLFRTSLEKALLSSPQACRQTVSTRLKTLDRDIAAGRKRADEWSDDIEKLRAIDAAAAAVTQSDFTRYQRLVGLLTSGTGDWKWNPSKRDDRLVVFTERIETLRFLQEHLPKDVAGLKAEQVAILYGGMSDVEQNAVVQDFATATKPVRLLLCSDVASEGINLHFLCHRLVHFDLPWSLMVFQQRNGRIDRYGQERVPLIQYLQQVSPNERVGREMRILEKLRTKDTQAAKNIADPSAFAGATDIDAQEEQTARAIEEGVSDDEFDRLLGLLDPVETTLASAGTALPSTPAAPELRSLFPSEFAHLQAALELFGTDPEPVRAEVNAAERYVEIQAPDDLMWHLGELPIEVLDKKTLKLTADRDRMQRAIRDARNEEAAWPTHQYLWSLHPVFEWVDDRARSRFGRHAAPVLALASGLEPGEAAVVVSGLVPNRQAQPVLHRWYTARFVRGRFVALEPFDATVERTGLGTTALPALDATADLPALQRLLPEATRRVKDEIVVDRRAVDADLKTRLDAYLDRLSALEDRQRAQLRRDYAPKDEAYAVGERRIGDTFKAVAVWAKAALETEAVPFLQVVAVLTHRGEAS